MQILIVLIGLLAASYLVKGIVDLLFNGEKKPELTEPVVTDDEPNIIIEDTPFPTPELEKSETKEKQVKPKAVKKPKAKPVKKEIMVKKEKKSKGKGDDLILS
jgi:outer membrane biosynthesis protein TonB